MNVQALFHPAGHDYEAGSPHLRHPALRARVAASLARLAGATPGGRALELGAGHGTFTSVLRDTGASVLVTEMSPASAAVLRERFAGDPGVTVVDDPDGDWAFRTQDAFDLVACVSVLHHIPDYLRTVGRLVELIGPGGAFVCWQDPTWYPTMPVAHRVLSTGAYFAWRVGRGDLARGAATRWRRLRRVYDADSPADMAEYHVVRHGVDQVALAALLRPAFREVAVTRYWSTQSPSLQWMGERLGAANTFGIEATGRLA